MNELERATERQRQATRTLELLKCRKIDQNGDDNVSRSVVNTVGGA